MVNGLRSRSFFLMAVFVSQLLLLILSQAAYGVPTSNAGPDQLVPDGAPVTLDGSGSSDPEGDPLMFEWSVLSCPAGVSGVVLNGTTLTVAGGETLNGNSLFYPTFTPPELGDYEFQLVVNDGTNTSLPDSVLISVLVFPVANAGSDQIGVSPGIVTLDGRGSTSPSGAPLSFIWSFESLPLGSSAGSTLSGDSIATFTADVKGDYVVGLVVNDGTINSLPDTVLINVLNNPPVVDAGPDQVVVQGGVIQPGARQDSVSWTDPSDNLWLFGGNGYDGSAITGYLNDLWKFDGTEWSWVSGDSVINQGGVYGTKGVASAANVPGSRDGSVSWTDLSGNLWLFGGLGYDGTGTLGRLNDLWKFDGTNWTWVSGPDVVNNRGVYGVKGVASASNVPGSRYGSVSWTDSSGNLWLFGGHGRSLSGVHGDFNDLWKFDGANWTWVSGSSDVNQSGVYGTQGVASAANVPGTRDGSVSWTDSGGNLWLFGGLGYDSTGLIGRLNDLWKFDGTNWTWVSGSSVRNERGVYGTQGVASASNVPGARFDSVSWTDSADNLWLFGGDGYDAGSSYGRLTDLWKYDGTNWTWVSGSNMRYVSGVYGTQGVPSASNFPGSRQSSVSWTDSGGNLWLFGGWGWDGFDTFGSLNDLWKFDGANWTWVSGSNHIDQSTVYSESQWLVTLDGSGSSDVDRDHLTFEWSVLSYPAGVSGVVLNGTYLTVAGGETLSGIDLFHPIFTPPQPGDYEFQLVVNDGTDSSLPDTVLITAEVGILADAGPDQLSAALGDIQLDGSGSTGDSLTYEWAVTRHPQGLGGVILAGTTITIGGATVSGTSLDMPVFSAASAGVYEFSLLVSNPADSDGPDFVTIAVSNTAPVAAAGADQHSLLPDTVQLDGTGSYDPDSDSIVTYEWAIESVPAGVGGVTVNGTSIFVGGATLAGTTLDGADRPVFAPDHPGDYTFSLAVSDGVLVSTPDLVIIRVYEDVDGDGMGDGWEVAHFGDTSRDGTGDANGNGVSDLEEFINGTDPTACVWTGTAPDLQTCVFHSAVLQNCLTDAETDGANNDIMVERGTYLGNFLYDTAEDYALALSGGWDPGCSGSVIDPSQTIIDGNASGTALTLLSTSGGPNAGLYVTGLTLTNGISGSDGGCGLLGSDSARIDFLGNMVNNCDAAQGGGASINTASGDAYVINNIVHGNSATDSGAGVLARASSGSITLLNNTFSDNHAANTGGGMAVWIDDDLGGADITNNIIWGNTVSVSTVGACPDVDIDSDVDLNGTQASVIFMNNDLNLASDLCVTDPAFVLDGSNIDVDPQFVDPLAGDYHIPDTSAVVDMGDNTHPILPLIDFEGEDRIQGTAVDMGADEVALILPDFIGYFRAGGVNRNEWYLDRNGNNAWDDNPPDLFYNRFGRATDIPIVGDWNGDGFTEIGIFRDGMWVLDMNGNGKADGGVIDRVYHFGRAGDMPVTGDWNGDGFTEIGIFRSANRMWVLDMNGNGKADGGIIDRVYHFGRAGDIPVTGDWNGNGVSKIGIFRSGLWVLDMNGNGTPDGNVTDRVYIFGRAGDIPVTGDWNGDGATKTGIFRSGLWVLDMNGNGTPDGNVIDRVIPSFGLATDIPLTGKW